MVRKWRQKTLTKYATYEGIGLHFGQNSHVKVSPNDPNAGIHFRIFSSSSDDLENDAQKQIVDEIRSSSIHHLIQDIDTKSSLFCTKLKTPRGFSIATIEHLMSALAGSGIHNACIDLTTTEASFKKANNIVEIPILDGSSLPFLEKIEALEQENTHLSYCEILKPVQVALQDKAAWFLPCPPQLHSPPCLNMSIQVNFAHKGLGNHFFHHVWDCKHTLKYQKEIAPARTFIFEEEIQQLQAIGLAQGGSLENAIVFNNKNASKESKIQVLNPSGLRFQEDEWVRHKMLDCIGDLALLGRPLHGFFMATSPGHALTHKLIQKLLQDPSNYKLNELNTVVD
jgi:UDP-3-O-[3-hydroxymyristoyl] N-acetylglucosamine deacetylase